MKTQSAEAEPFVRLEWPHGAEASALREREWLVTNGLGGFASGSLLGNPTRRYHGIFVPNLTSPKGRFVAMPCIDEQVELNGEWINLGGAEQLDGSMATRSHHYLRAFHLDALIPTWTFELAGRTLAKSIVMPHLQNTACLRYQLTSGAPLRMRLRIYAASRRIDEVLAPRDDWPFTMQLTGCDMSLTMHDHPVSVWLRPTPWHAFVVDPKVDHGVLYRVERARGYDHSGNLFSPGYFEIALHAGEEAFLLLSTEHRAILDVPPACMFEAERNRLTRLADRACGERSDPLLRHLAMAADQFIVVPGSRREEALIAAAAGEDFRSVMAGYHWFNDWGRDTMISLEGLALCTGRHDEARAILRTFAGYIKDGLLPNLFPEGEREALYHTVDATLWYFHALQRYVTHTGDIELVRQLYPKLVSVIDHHVAGTHFGIGVDAQDGLLAAAAEGYQLTWMDAKVDGWVVTPRRGKPVEIQALWFNALSCMAAWSRRLGDEECEAQATRCEALAERVHASFNAHFWNAATGHLFDVVDGPDGDDASLRPNQVFAVSLDHPVLDEPHRAAMLRTVAQQLLTPYGLRTLGPGHPDYKPHYQGTLRERDAAYHQGTVWPWLLGHFFDACRRVGIQDDALREPLRALEEHLHDAGMGSISEVFDAEPPHIPRGCIAQAWSVAEALRIRWTQAAHQATRSDTSNATTKPRSHARESEPEHTGEEDPLAGLADARVAG